MSEYLPATNESKFSDFSYLINNNFYDFRVFLGSYDGRLKLLSPSSIKSLNIEDSIDNPFHSGFIILDNRQDNLESSYDSTIDQSNPKYYMPGQSTTSTIQETFMFNGDSRDILRVQILPKLSQQTTNITDQEVLKHFLLSFDFAIYNTEELDDGTMDGKLKKLYFWELDYEILRTKNSYFSTSNYVNTREENIQDLSNTERRILTGAALSAALLEGLTKNDGFTTTFGSFDPGSTSIFFSAPGDFKCIDTINYILDRHVSDAGSNYSPGLLQLERYPKVYTLRSFKDVFQSAVQNTGGQFIAGPDYLETYKIAGYSDNKSDRLPRFNIEFAPAYAPFFQAEGNLDVYSFDSVAGLYTQTEINSKIVHYYNYTDKEFEIESNRNSIDAFDKIANEHYVYPFSPQGAKTFQLGNNRTTNKNTTNEFAAIELDQNQRLSLGLAKNLKNYVYLNNFTTFRVQGATHRQAGKFIGITRENNKQPTLFDSKFLGIYFILSVKHIFEDAKYINEVVCVKTYLPTDIFLNKNIP